MMVVHVRVCSPDLPLPHMKIIHSHKIENVIYVHEGSLHGKEAITVKMVV